MKKLLEKTEKSGQLSQEVRKCIQSASTLDDIETLAALVPSINDITSILKKQNDTSHCEIPKKVLPAFDKVFHVHLRGLQKYAKNQTV